MRNLWVALLALVFLPAVSAAGGSGGAPPLPGPAGAGSEETAWNFKLKGLAGFSPASYNRVDGLLAGWGFDLSAGRTFTYPGSGTRQTVPDRRYPELSFELLVPSARSSLGGRLGITRRLRGKNNWDLGLELGAGGSSSDYWRASEPGAGISFLFLGKDRRYYYDRRGGELYAEGELGGGLRLRLAFYHERVRSLEATNVWTMFSSGLLRENPSVIHGTDRGIRLNLGLDRLLRGIAFPEGWECSLGLESSGALGGDFAYRLFELSAGFYRKLGELNYFSAGLKAATSDRTLPPHKLYSLGDLLRGIDTFEPDFDLFDRRGDRLWYICLGFHRLITPPDLFFNRLAYNWSLDLYFTSGTTFHSPRRNDPLTLFSRGLERLESGVGAGVSFTASRTRVSLCLEKSLDRQYRGPVFSVRLGLCP
ncbi:MAG: hypothetical protein JXQ83_05680 [Candidatus Glassbacteria bacterium]|nr:hypothetical protein [Candidatus Glassbacteria bacterium]